MAASSDSIWYAKNSCYPVDFAFFKSDVHIYKY